MCDGLLVMNEDKKFMKEAIKEANKALLIDEVPVGCVIVHNNKIIARGYNKREKEQDSTSHAEINAIRKASKKINNWRLCDMDIYVTVEPCIMCAGAIMWSRFRRVIYGAKDPKGGALGTSINVFNTPNINHHPEIISGVLEEECAAIIKNYFKAKRAK